MIDHPLVGIWRLTAMRRVDLEGNETAMDVLTGLLTYTPEGWMTEALEYCMAGSEDPPNYVFYAGRFEVDGDSLFHQPLVHTDSSLVGQKLQRGYDVSGDRFTLTARNPNGATYLFWERVPV